MAEDTQKLTQKERAERYKMALQAIHKTVGSTSYTTIQDIVETALAEGE